MVCIVIGTGQNGTDLGRERQQRRAGKGKHERAKDGEALVVGRAPDEIGQRAMAGGSDERVVGHG